MSGYQMKDIVIVDSDTKNTTIQIGGPSQPPKFSPPPPPVNSPPPPADILPPPPPPEDIPADIFPPPPVQPALTVDDVRLDEPYPPPQPVVDPYPPPDDIHATPNNGEVPIGFAGLTRNGSNNPAYIPVEESLPPNTPIGFEGVANPTPPSGNLYPPLSREPTPVETPLAVSASEIKSTIPPESDGVELIDMEPQKNGSNSDQRDTMFFNDGQARIDYILAYQDNPDREQKRIAFEANLRGDGLRLETEDKSQSQDGKIYFVKVHAPWEALARYAEMMKIKMPIKSNDMGDDAEPTCGKCMSCCNCFELGEELVQEEENYFTAEFSRYRLEQFVIKDKDTFFTNAQRSRIVYEILTRTRYDEETKKFGIKRLLSNGTYVAAYPLHEGPFKSDHSILVHGAQNDRHLLYEAWARSKRTFKFQPLDLVRKYFGEKIGIYFTWLGFYTTMLIPAALIGVIVFIYGWGSLWNDVPAQEICDTNGAGNTIMCPLCDQRCKYWRLNTSCLYSQLTYLFDNYGTVAFAIFMSLWATFFIEFWKRKSAEIHYDWDVASYEEEEENVRPEYEATVRHKRKNPVTQDYEPYLPTWAKVPRWMSSVVVVFFMIALVLAAIFAIILYRIVIVVLLHSANVPYVSSYAGLVKSATAALISLVVIFILNKLYEKVALFLTNWETHRTESEWEDSFTTKMFLFQAVNYYGTIFYIAFFKGRFVGRPGSYDRGLNYRLDECDPSGCLIDLCIQLAIVMVGKQAFNNFKELLLPYILTCLRSRQSKKKADEQNVYTRWEQDFDLSTIPANGLFEEYLEMVIQFGFVTIFVAAFPLAPLFALLNNIIEIRLDAYKFVCVWRRPMAAKAQDIGVWFYIIKMVARLATLTNAFIIAFTSDFVPKMVYRYFYSPYNGENEQIMKGYVAWSLSSFNVTDFEPLSRPSDTNITGGGIVNDCSYRDFRSGQEDNYSFTLAYWHVLAARIAFVLVFEHLVIFLTMLVAYLIPDVPTDVKLQELREKYLSKQALYNAELIRAKSTKESPGKID